MCMTKPTGGMHQKLDYIAIKVCCCFFNLKMHQKYPIEMPKLSMSGFLLKPLTDEGLLNPGLSLPNIFLLEKNFNL